MIKSKKLASLSILLVIAIVMQLRWPAPALTSRAVGRQEIVTTTRAPEGPALSGYARSPEASLAPDTVFLPVIVRPPAPPAFEIISPQEGWTISGPLFFAVQPSRPATISSVSFEAGSSDLGTDATPQDGYRVFLDAGQFPAGSLQLAATATGPTGVVTKTVNVNVAPNPPSSATIGALGGALASEIGSIITFRPGAVPDGTTITVTEKTQAEVTAENGFDWDAMGVTFLGAQAISSTSPVSLPLGVASAGFGPRVQPGQVVVNYNILPDADGDGVDELVVVNSASVAPNDDVISDPVPQVQLGSAAMTALTGGAVALGLNNGVSGSPGTVIEIDATGFNPASILGNVAEYRSLGDGTAFTVPVFVRPTRSGDAGQSVFTLIPPISPGPATLTLRNASTGSVSDPMSITAEMPPPLSKPASEIVDETLALATGAIDELLNIANQEGVSLPADVESVKNQISLLRTMIQDIATNPTPADEQLLTSLAIMIENSDVNSLLQTLTPSLSVQPGSLVGAGDRLVNGLGWLGAAIVGAITVAAAVGTLPAWAIAAGVVAVGLMLVAAVWYFATGAIELVSTAVTAVRNMLNGMGATPPVGGNGGGNAPTPPEPDSGATALRVQSGFLDHRPGRVIVKVVSAGFPLPFSGATDGGGYFFVPLIPGGEPFVATAIDTQTGQTRTFEGIGPPEGESVLMFFDFLGEGTDGATELRFGEVVSHSLTTTDALRIYTFNGNAGDQVRARVRALTASFNPVVELFSTDGSPLCQLFGTATQATDVTCTLATSGAHTIVVSEFGQDNTGSYNLYLQRLNNPGGAVPISVGAVISGTVDPDMELDTYSFTGGAGDQMFVRANGFVSHAPRFWLYRPDGTLLCTDRADTLFVETTCTLDVNGAHTLLYGDWGGNNSGSYQLTLQRLNSPVNALPASFGETISATIGFAVEIDVYTISGTIGDQLFVKMSQPGGTVGALDPQFRVFRPDGSLLCENADFSGIQIEATCTIDASGLHHMFASDYQGNRAGIYALYLQRLNAPANTTPLPFGEIVSGTVEAEAKTDTYIFAGMNGDRVNVRMVRTATTSSFPYWPKFSLYRQDGTLLCSAHSSLLAEELCALDGDGTYALLAGNFQGVGAYNLLLERTNSPANGMTIAYGETMTDTISAPVELDAYVFSGTAAEQVLFRMTRISGALDPYFAVYRPDGTLLCSAQSGTSVAETTCTLDATGQHTLLVGDTGGTDAGTYTVFVDRTG